MIHLDPVQSYALLGLVAIGCGVCAWLLSPLVALAGEGDELEVNPYDRDLDPFGYIDEETDRWRDQQLLDDDLEDRHG